MSEQSIDSSTSRAIALPMNGVLHDHDDQIIDNDDSESKGNASLRGLLCTSCKRLDLSVSRFIIDSAPRHATNEVRNYYLRKTIAVASKDNYSASKRFCLGTLGDISYRASECSFCDLVKRGLFEEVIKDFLKYNIGADGTAPADLILSASWEIDGRARTRNDGMTSRTRRLHLRWNRTGLSEAYVVFLPADEYRPPSSDAPSVYRDDALFLGRPIDSTGKNRALMKSWFDLCRHNHQAPCKSDKGSLGPFINMLNSSYFGVIDVYTLQLTYLPHDGTQYEPFAALSYVWGSEKVKKKYKTVLKNVMRHRTHGGLEGVMHELPQAIQDAIALVPTLGLRYLWVDSLCIVQDSSRSWKLNAFNMNLIYGHAALTICAADGEDSSEGLLAMHRKKRTPAQHTAEIESGFRLMLTRPPEAAIRKSTWATRAWTFQERLLSPRTLIFVDGRVYFQCRSTAMSEDIVADKEGAGWSLDLVDAPLQILRQIDKRPL